MCFSFATAKRLHNSCAGGKIVVPTHTNCTKATKTFHCFLPVYQLLLFLLTWVCVFHLCAFNAWRVSRLWRKSTVQTYNSHRLLIHGHRLDRNWMHARECSGAWFANHCVFYTDFPAKIMCVVLKQNQSVYISVYLSRLKM